MSFSQNHTVCTGMLLWAHFEFGSLEIRTKTYERKFSTNVWPKLKGTKGNTRPRTMHLDDGRCIFLLNSPTFIGTHCAYFGWGNRSALQLHTGPCMTAANWLSLNPWPLDHFEKCKGWHDEFGNTKGKNNEFLCTPHRSCGRLWMVKI